MPMTSPKSFRGGVASDLMVAEGVNIAKGERLFVFEKRGVGGDSAVGAASLLTQGLR